MQTEQGGSIQSYFQLMQAMDTLYEEYARKKGLTYMSLYILETVYEQGECTQKEIAAITLYPKQTVNMVIRSFLQKGWVALFSDEVDRRNKRVSLTKDGSAFAKAVIEPLWEAGCAAFMELDTGEREVMLRTLREFSVSFMKRVRES